MSRITTKIATASCSLKNVIMKHDKIGNNIPLKEIEDKNR